MIDVSKHKAVVMVGDAQYFYGFTTFAAAVSFLENQMIGESSDKVMANIASVLDGGSVEINGVSHSVLDINGYVDNYTSDEDE